MRQTLLRIRLDELWSLDPVEGVTAIGVGWLAVVWLLCGVAWLVWSRKNFKWSAEWLSPVLFWGIVAAGLFSAPWWAGGWFLKGLPVYGYGFMLFLAFVAGGWTAGRRAESVGIHRDVMWDAAMWLFVAGILGARLFYLAQYHDRVFSHRVDGQVVPKEGLDLIWAAINLPDGGLVFYGGVIGGIAALLLFCRVRRIDPLRLGDVIVPSAFLGVAFGRMGCFLNGCCYGDRCDLPWGVAFPEGSVPYGVLLDRGFLSPEATTTIPLHPAQLYSVINALVLAAVTHAYFRYRHRDGAVLAVGWLTYPLTRFVLETLRGDELGQLGTPLTISQWVSLGLFAGGVAYAIWLSRRDRAPVFPARGEIAAPRTS